MGRCEPGFVRRHGLASVTDHLYSRYRADTDVKLFLLFLAMTPNGVTENLQSPKSKNHVLAVLS